MKRPKVCLVTHSLLVVKFFLIPQIIALSEKYDVTLVANVDNKEFLEKMNLPVRVVHMPIKRKIALFSDLTALLLMIKFLLFEDFDIVHTVSPKAGVVGIWAAWLTRVPVRLHVFQGEVWLTRKGVWRFILKNVDRLVAMLATHLLVVSKTERQFLIDQKIISAAKSTVLGAGSICGVDFERFKPDPEAKERIRKGFAILKDDIALLYVGRLNRDKGIYELVQAFEAISINENAQNNSSKVHLMIVGPDEENVLQCLDIKAEVKPFIHFHSYTEQPEKFMAASDVLVLPSHREGFGLVIIEAAAIGIPAVASNIYGITDALVDGETGLLFKLGDVADLSKKLGVLINNKSLRERLGVAAFDRCKSNFNQQYIVNETLSFYREQLVDF